MSQSATYSVVLTPAAVTTSGLVSAGAMGASAARASVRRLDRWLEKTTQELRTMNLGTESIVGRLAAEPGALLPLCEQLRLAAGADVRGVLGALEAQPFSERSALVGHAVESYRARAASYFARSISMTLRDLGYERRRSNGDVATYAHRDGTSVAVTARPNSASPACEIELGGFSDGRCRNVRAAIERGLRRHGVELRIVAADDLPLSTGGRGQCRTPARGLLR